MSRLCSSGSSAARPRRELPLVAAAKVIERAPFAELLDHGRAHVRRAGDGWGVAELVAHPAHRRRDRPRRVGLRRRRAVLGERDRRRQAPAPRPEVLRREPAAEVLGEVLVQERRGQVAEAALVLEPEQTRAAREAEQLLDRVGELGVDERRPDERAVLGAKRESQPRPADVDVTLAQRRHAVGPRAAGIRLRAHPEPGPVDQRHGVGERPLGAERLAEHVARHRPPAARAEARRSARGRRTSPAPAPPGNRGGRGTAAVRPRRCPLPAASHPGWARSRRPARRAG